MGSERRRKRKPRYERRIFTLALLTGLPAVALALVLLWRGDFAARTQWTLTILLVGVWLAFVGVVRERVVRPLQTISNMLAALREGDFSLRARGSDPDDALGLLLVELNSLGEDLRAQRLGALEATALLRRVMEEIDVAVFAFDESRALRLVNRGGAALLGRPVEQLLGKDAAELGLGDSLAGDAPRVLAIAFPGRPGRGRRGPRTGAVGPGGIAQSSDGGLRAAGATAASAPRARPGRRVGAPRGRAGDAPAGHRVSRPRPDDPRRRWAARPAADQPGAECRRCHTRGRRRGGVGVDDARRPAGGVGAGRRPRPGRHGQPVRAVLHHEGGRLRHRAGVVAPDRRGTRRQAHAGQSGGGEGLRSPGDPPHPRPRVSRAPGYAGNGTSLRARSSHSTRRTQRKLSRKESVATRCSSG